MAKRSEAASFDHHIREIRKDVFGRENRVPIAEALEHIDDSGQSMLHLLEVEAVAITGETDNYRLVLHYAGE